MAIKDARSVQYLSFERGVDDTTNATHPTLIQGTLRSALNTDIINEDLLTKRKGYEEKADWGSRRIRGGFEYTGSAGVKTVLLYGESATTTGTTGELGSMTSGFTITSLKTGLQDNIKPRIAQFRNLAFLFNTGSNLLYDGTNVRQIGINAPNDKPVFVKNIDGSLNTNGSYKFAYTYYNSTTGAESTPSLASDTMTSGSTSSTDGIQVSVTSGDSSLADKIRIYRTVAGGSIFFLDGSTTISSTTYDSTVSDSGLGDEMELDNGTLSGLGKIATVEDNRVFVVTDDNKNRIHYSKIGIRGPMPESFQVLDFVDCNINDGDEIVGLGSVNNTVIVIKTRSVGKLVRIDATIGGLERTGSAKYIYQEISTNVTGLSHDCMTVVGNLVIWLGRNSQIYGTDGRQIFQFGDRIQTTLDSLNYQQAHKFSVVNDQANKKVIWSVCRTGQQEPDLQIVGFYRRFPEVAFTFYSPGTDSGTHPGIRAASLFTATVQNTNVIYFGNSNADGKIHQLDKGHSDNSDPIFWEVKFPWEGRPDPTRQKNYAAYHYFAAGSGENYNLTSEFYIDFKSEADETLTTTLQGTDDTNWNEANWNEFNWGLARFKPISFFPKLRAYFGQLVLKNTNADQPVALKSATLQLQVGNRRAA